MPFTPGDYNRRARIALATASVVGGPHAHMLLRITADALPDDMLDLDGTIPCQANGGDVRFSADQDGINQLPFHLLGITLDNDPALSTFEGRVRATNLENGVAQFIYVWWRSSVGTQTQPAATEDIGRDAVYSSYAHAYDFEQDPSGPAPQYIDVTGNGAGLTSDVATPPLQGPAIVSPTSMRGTSTGPGYYAENFGGATWDVDASTDNRGAIVSLWHRHNQRPAGGSDLFEIQDVRGAPGSFVRFSVQKTTDNLLVVMEGDSGFQIAFVDESTTSPGDVVHYAFVFLADDTVRILRNGTQVAQANSNVGVGGSPIFNQIRVGSGEFTNGPDGDHDELLIGPTNGDTDYSVAWAQTYYAIYNNAASFFTPNAPEATQVTAQLTLPGLPTGTLAVLFQATSAGELVADGADPTGYSVFDSVTSSVANQQLDYQVTDFADVILVLRQAGYLPKRIFLEDLTSAGSSIPAGALFQADRNYDSTVTAAALEVLSGGSVIGSGTDPLSYDLATLQLTLREAMPVGRLYSELMDSFISIQRLWGEFFPMELLSETAGEAVFGRSDGVFHGATFADDASRNLLQRAGWVEFGSTGAINRLYAGIQTTGLSDTGFTLRAQTSTFADGVAFPAGAVRQAVRYFTGGTHLVVKTQRAGFRPTSFDILAELEESTLEPRLYVVGVNPINIDDLDGSDPGAFVGTVTVHPTPVSWQGLDWSVTIQTTDSAANLFARLNYAIAQGGNFQTIFAFNWPELLVPNGDNIDTARGEVIGTAGATLKGVRVIDSNGDPLPGIARMQSDSGAYYVPPVQVSLTLDVAFEGTAPATFEWRLYEAGAPPRTELDGEEARAGTSPTLVYAYDAADAGSDVLVQILAPPGFEEVSETVTLSAANASRTIAVPAQTAF